MTRLSPTAWGNAEAVIDAKLVPRTESDGYGADGGQKYFHGAGAAGALASFDVPRRLLQVDEPLLELAAELVRAKVRGVLVPEPAEGVNQ